MNRIHVTKELVALAVLLAGLEFGLGLAIGRRPPPSLEGWVLIAIALGVAGAILWTVLNHLRTQWLLEIRNDDLIAATWFDSLRGKSGRRIDIPDIARLVRRRPAFIDIETRKGLVRLDAQGWGRRQRHELEKLAMDLGVAMEDAT